MINITKTQTIRIELIQTITQSDYFPQQNSKRPDVRLSRIFRQYQRLWRHPTNGQTSLTNT